MADSQTLATTATPPPALQVLDWLLSGATETQVAEALAAKYPGCNRRQIMAEVQQQLAAAGNPSTDAVRGWALLSLRKIYPNMLQVGDFDGARKCIVEITRLGAIG
jgi:hypothetical protein